jgi:hypothetical protein
MNWLSNFLGLKKVKTPAVKKAEEMEFDFDTTGYLMNLERKEGFEDQIQTGRKKPKLAGKSYLGV